MPRQMTDDEVRAAFLRHVWTMIDYWAADRRTPDTRDKLAGLAFSILTAIDGFSMALPAFTLAPDPHPDDAAFHAANGVDWYPPGPDVEHNIAGGLHDAFYAADPKPRGAPMPVSIDRAAQVNALTQALYNDMPGAPPLLPGGRVSAAGSRHWSFCWTIASAIIDRPSDASDKAPGAAPSIDDPAAFAAGVASFVFGELERAELVGQMLPSGDHRLVTGSEEWRIAMDARKRIEAEIVLRLENRQPTATTPPPPIDHAQVDRLTCRFLEDVKGTIDEIEASPAPGRLVAAIGYRLTHGRDDRAKSLVFAFLSMCAERLQR